MANPCKHPIVILKDVRFIDLKAIIDFMYKGEVNVSQDQLSALLKTAETLKVKGLAEVTEKQARGQPQLQHALFASTTKNKKRKRNRNKGGLKTESGQESSESEDEATKLQRASANRLGVQRVQMEKEHATGSVLGGEQMEPSRILEQSMATAEVGETSENAQEGQVIVASEVPVLADEGNIRFPFDIPTMCIFSHDGRLHCCPIALG